MRKRDRRSGSWDLSEKLQVRTGDFWWRARRARVNSEEEPEVSKERQELDLKELGTLTGKSIELEKILRKRKFNIECVQETRWIGSSARDANGYKIWNSGTQKGKNGVSILADRELRESVVEVRRVNDRLMIIKLMVGQCTLNVVSAYVPHVGLDEEVKRRFWEGLDEIMHQVPPAEKLFIGWDYNGHIGETASGYDEVHGGFSFGERNGGGT
uniref:Uncharacterized protein LOC104215318 n=1 Tax=Nicotiana sylvestris TaxID=4096 RepID=A0A1U7VEP1_NICSY|nr:PREDICTED: uncharacterized protein LOC104215318 [Nicotiana sylvestris]